MQNNEVKPLFVASGCSVGHGFKPPDAEQSETRYSRVRDHKLIFSDSDSGELKPPSLSSKGIDQYSIHSTGSVDSGQVSMSENLECIKKIGQGGHGEVWLVKADGAVDEHAWKALFNQNRLETELVKLSRAGHQRNIVSCLGIAEIGGRQGLLMEYIPGMDLSDYFSQMVSQYLCGTLSHTDFWSAIQYIIKETLTGIASLEENGYAHQDIKPGNIRVHQSRLLPVIVDFGNSASFGEAHTIGTEFYAPPESLANYGCVAVSDKFDTYSVGQIVYTLLATITDSGVRHLFTAGAIHEDIIACERAGLLLRLCQAMQHYQAVDNTGQHHKALTPITSEELQGRLQDALTGHDKLTKELREAYSRAGNAAVPLDRMLIRKLPKIIAGKIKVGRYRAGYASSLVRFINAALHPAPDMRLNAKAALQQPFLSDPLYSDDMAAKNVLSRVFAQQQLTIASC